MDKKMFAGQPNPTHVSGTKNELFPINTDLSPTCEAQINRDGSLGTYTKKKNDK